MLPPLGSEPQAPDCQVLHATPHLTPYVLKSQLFRSLYSHALLILGLRIFLGSIEQDYIRIWRTETSPTGELGVGELGEG